MILHSLMPASKEGVRNLTGSSGRIDKTKMIPKLCRYVTSLPGADKNVFLPQDAKDSAHAHRRTRSSSQVDKYIQLDLPHPANGKAHTDRIILCAAGLSDISCGVPQNRNASLCRGHAVPNQSHGASHQNSKGHRDTIPPTAREAGRGYHQPPRISTQT
jgi:hypothetical protein